MATTEDLTKIKTLLSSTDVIDSSTRKRANTNWNFYKLTNVTKCVAILRVVPMGCRNTILQDPLLKKYSIKCLTFKKSTRKPFNDNLFLFVASALYLHANERLESETSKFFHLFLEKPDGNDPANFRGVLWKILPQWRILFRQTFSRTLLTMQTYL